MSAEDVKKNWKTTAAGVLGAVSVVAAAAAKLLSGDHSIDPAEVLAALAVLGTSFGLIAAKDGTSK